MFKNKQKHFLISVLLMILFLAALGTAFSADLNETSEVPEVSVCKDNLENSQNDIVGSSEITLNGGKFSDIQKAIDDIDNGGTIHLNGYYSAQNKDSHVYVNKNINIVGGSDTVLDGKNIRFEELPCKKQNLSFDVLQHKLKESVQIESFNKDTLKTLNLYNDQNGYNNAAGILADQNDFPGIDIVKFGENISIIKKRATFDNISILEVYDKSIDIFRDYYQYEVIESADRKKVEKVPEAAFREAIANALIYRVWDVESQIRVLMFDDKIEVVSPGGLPAGITEDEYLDGKISVLRNRNLANVFYRLGFVEIFGTGIKRIKQLYEEGLQKPDFDVTENTIKIILPIFEKNANLTEDERRIYKVLSKTMLKSISEIAPYVPFGKSKTTQLLKEMRKKGVVVIAGRGRGTKYRIK